MVFSTYSPGNTRGDYSPQAYLTLPTRDLVPGKPQTAFSCPLRSGPLPHDPAGALDWACEYSRRNLNGNRRALSNKSETS